jgi:hypothetical protein
MPRLLPLALRAQQWLPRRAFATATERPADAQARVLRALLQANADTAFGRDHGFASLRTPREYAGRVPIRDYEALRPYMARLLGGERGVLTAEPPRAFATTSGTTGEPKLVPVTPTSARQSAALMRLWTVNALDAHPGLLDHRVLTMVGPAVEGTTPGGVPYGAMTGMTFRRLPWLVRRRQVLPDAVALVRDHDARYLVAARLALAQEVSSIGTPNASTLLRLAETAERYGPELIRAVHDGTLGVVDLEPIAGAGLGAAELRAALSAGLRPDRRRSAVLASVMTRRGRLILGECWPELSLLACWLGGSAGVQARHLDAHFAGVPRRDLGLIASEGRLTVPLEDGSAAGVLAVHTSFFEFVPEDEIDVPSPRPRLCHELEDGHRYYVIVTGANGLYRYDLNDVVEVRGFHHRTPRVAFVRKGRDMVSITGEKLHLNHLLHAVGAAGRASGLDVWQFRVIPDLETARYDLLVELPRPPACREALLDFGTAFDLALADVNVEYASKRGSRRLSAPRLFVMRPGWSERLCRQEFARGRRDVQHKWNAIGLTWDAASRTEIALRMDGEGSEVSS